MNLLDEEKSNSLNNKLSNNYDKSLDQSQLESQVTCYLGLGANLSTEKGSPEQHINGAIHQLCEHDRIFAVYCSSLYVSKPMGPQDQPDFVNAVVKLETNLSPIDLLEVCQHLEAQAGRVRKRHWGERSLDVDILLYGDEYINLPNLTIPHVGISDRNFVLIPMLELSPNLSISGTPLKTLAQSQNWEGLSRLR